MVRKEVNVKAVSFEAIVENSMCDHCGVSAVDWKKRSESK